ncbi:MAG: type I methionyl aminopeptidase [Armatimonadota bacterium]|nr:type I methionyl aminopeptidase [Armatimonadota bacterium]
MEYPLKSEEEIAQMRAAGLIVWEAHQVARERLRPGVTTADINRAVEEFIYSRGALPLFKGVPGTRIPFPAATCISVNDEVVHGIPGPRALREGDLVGIDIGVKYNGWCGDAAVTHAVGSVSPEARRLMEVTEEALRLAIVLMGRKTFWSQVAREIQRFVERAGFSVVEALTGHGIGREMWEGIQAPNYFSPEYRKCGDFALQPGVVVAVEPMVNAGSKEVYHKEDTWTVATQDGRPSAHFEHTVAVTRAGVMVLTAGPEGQGWAMP